MEFKIRNCKDLPDLALNINGVDIYSSSETKFLGLIIDRNLTFTNHKDWVCKKLSSGIFVLRQLSKFLSSDVLLTAYYGLVYPFLSYAVPIWGYQSTSSQFIFRLQKKAIRAVFGKPSRASCKPLFADNGILTFPSIYILSTVLFVHKHLHLFAEIAPPSHQYNLRPNNSIQVPVHKTSFYEHHLRFTGIKLYNALPDSVKTESNINTFKTN